MSAALKSNVVADRYSILKTIIAEMKKSKLSKDEFAIALENSIDKILDRDFEIKKLTKPKKFRRMSPYIAFCKNFRDENRNADGKIKGDVHEITREAGKTWKSLTEDQKKFWSKIANDLTEKAKIAFEKSKKEDTKPTSNDIDTSNKNQLKKIAKRYNVVIPEKSDIDDIRFLIKYAI